MANEHIFLTGDREKDTRRVTYLIFITGISILSFVVASLYYLIRDPEIKQVLIILDTIYAIVFLIDFFLRLRASSNRAKYFLSWGWLDLVTSIPGIPALRIIHALLVLRSAREISAATPDEIEKEARERLGESVLLITISLGLLVITVGSILIVLVEADAPGAEITSGYDAMWWSLVTVSTVGYGDEVPVTSQGRLIGVLMIVVGVALFTTTTSYLASSFTDRGAQQQREQQLELAQNNARQFEALLERIMALEERIATQVGVPDAEMKDIEGTAGGADEEGSG